MHRLFRIIIRVYVSTALLLLSLTTTLVTGQAWAIGDDEPEPQATIEPPSPNLHRIRCEGPLPKWSLPIFSDWNPNQATLQQICAEEIDGGVPPTGTHRRSLGFSCYGVRNDLLDIQNDDGPILPEIRYRYSRDSSPLESYPRLLLYCHDRCFCDNQPNGRIVSKPKGHTAGETLRLPPHLIPPYPSTASYLIGIHEPLGHIQQGTLNAKVTSVMKWSSEYLAAWAPREDIYFTLSHVNMIRCSNEPLPTSFGLLDGYDISEFRSIQELCATSLDGGKPGANAGAYCDPGDNGEHGLDWDDSDLWFSDEMTPRVSWTWEGNFPFSAYIRGYCWMKCNCRFRGHPKVRPARKLFKLLRDVDLAPRFNSSGLRIAKNPDGSSSKAKQIDIDPPDLISTHCSAGSCQRDPWPRDILGPPPGLRPPGRKANTISSSFGTCGGRCNGPAAQQCQGWKQEKNAGDCRCRVPPSSITRELGLDAAFPSAWCLGAAAVTQWYRQRGRCSTGALGSCAGNLRGRRDKQLSGIEPEEWACPCNSTYTSRRCCESIDGMIWEAEADR